MEKLKNRVEGIIPAVHTPFHPDGRLDENGFRENIRYYLEKGVHGIMVNGCTGENVLLSADEKRKLAEVAVNEVKGRVPVIVGTGANSTEETVAFTQHAKKVGADAAMIVTPFFAIPSPEGVYEHYRIVSESVDIPLVLYNIPQLTGVDLKPALVARLAELHTVVALKDSSGKLSNFAETIALVGNRISVLTGCDDLLFPCFLMGAAGAIVALGNIAPLEIVKMFNLVRSGKIEEAKEIYYRLLPIARAISAETDFPAQVKVAVSMLGRPAGPTRKPLSMPTDEEKTKIRKALQEAGLLPL